MHKNIIIFLIVVVSWFLMIALASESVAAEKDLYPITLQLKWTHQFQFSGYYMARENGYYRDVGLNVEIIEGSSGIDVTELVLAGKADFGVGTSGLMLDYAVGKPVVVLGVIYQHSPLVMIGYSNQESVRDLDDLAKNPLMIEPNSADLLAMFVRRGIAIESLDLIDYIGDIGSISNQKSIAFSAYMTDEPYVLDQKGIEYTMFSPRTYGIDFYGDNFFTSREMVRDHSKIVEAFRDATVLGWEYALNHPEEAVDLILEKYQSKKSRSALLYEAEVTGELMTRLVSPGFMLPSRWQNIAETYISLGMLEKQPDLDDYILWPKEDGFPRWVPWALIVTLLLIVLLSLLSLYFRALNSRLRNEVEVRRKTEQQLIDVNCAIKIARDQAEEANRNKTIFISNVSHDLRAPISSIISLANIFRHHSKKLELPEKFNRFLGQLHSGSEFLMLMLNNILDFSAFELDSATVLNEPIEVDKWSGVINDLVTPMAEVKNINVNIELSPAGAIINSDISRLSQILLNLIQNAVKFSKVDGVVYVGISCIDERLEFVVRDCGHGIPVEERRLVFDMFSQGAEGLSSRAGNGLGLSIVKRNVELLGGTVSIAESPCGGAEFIVKMLVEKVVIEARG